MSSTLILSTHLFAFLFNCLSLINHNIYLLRGKTKIFLALFFLEVCTDTARRT